MNSIGGFILNLVRINFKFDKLECEDVLKNRYLIVLITQTVHLNCSLKLFIAKSF